MFRICKIIKILRKKKESIVTLQGTNNYQYLSNQRTIKRNILGQI